MKSEISFFFIGIELLYVVVLVSAVQHCESAICIHMSPPSRCSLSTHPPFHPLQVIAEHLAEFPVLCSSLPLAVLHRVVSSVLPTLSFLPCKQVHLYNFSRFHICCYSVAQSCLFATPWAIFHIYAFIYDDIAIF